MPPPQVRLQGLQSPQGPQVSLCRLTLGAWRRRHAQEPESALRVPTRAPRGSRQPCLRTTLPHPHRAPGALRDPAAPPGTPAWSAASQLPPEGAGAGLPSVPAATTAAPAPCQAPSCSPLACAESNLTVEVSANCLAGSLRVSRSRLSQEGDIKGQEDRRAVQVSPAGSAMLHQDLAWNSHTTPCGTCFCPVWWPPFWKGLWFWPLKIS